MRETKQVRGGARGVREARSREEVTPQTRRHKGLTTVAGGIKRMGVRMRRRVFQGLALTLPRWVLFCRPGA